jgi:hypothetical protein
MLYQLLKKALWTVGLVVTFGFLLNEIPAWWIFPSAPRYYDTGCYMSYEMMYFRERKPQPHRNGASIMNDVKYLLRRSHRWAIL